MDSPISAVFLDRDGVINENRSDHVKNWSEFHFLPGTMEALARLARERLPVFVITNQSIVNRGLVSSETVDEINERMKLEIERYGGHVEAVLYCPHVPEEHCICRKPEPGLLLAASTDYGIDLNMSYFVGDAITDIQAGKAAGCQTIMVLTGRGLEQHKSALESGYIGYHLARDLSEAVNLVLEQHIVSEALPNLKDRLALDVLFAPY